MSAAPQRSLPVAGRNALLAFVVGVIAVGALIWSTASGPAPIDRSRRTVLGAQTSIPIPLNTAAAPRQPPPPPPTMPPAPDVRRKPPPNRRWWLALAAAAALGALVAALVRVVRGRRRRERGAHLAVPRSGRPADVLDDRAVEDAVADASATALAQLDSGPPRDAIVACWMQFEALAGSAGIEPLPADTSTELAERLLRSLPVRREQVDALSALYREARFSDHELGEAERGRARLALRTIHDELRGRHP